MTPKLPLKFFKERPSLTDWLAHVGQSGPTSDFRLQTLLTLTLTSSITAVSTKSKAKVLVCPVLQDHV